MNKKTTIIGITILLVIFTLSFLVYLSNKNQINTVPYVILITDMSNGQSQIAGTGLYNDRTRTFTPTLNGKYSYTIITMEELNKQILEVNLKRAEDAKAKLKEPAFPQDTTKKDSVK